LITRLPSCASCTARVISASISWFSVFRRRRRRETTRITSASSGAMSRVTSVSFQL
jgi:hypothetical protein